MEFIFCCCCCCCCFEEDANRTFLDEEGVLPLTMERCGVGTGGAVMRGCELPVIIVLLGACGVCAGLLVDGATFNIGSPCVITTLPLLRT